MNNSLPKVGPTEDTWTKSGVLNSEFTTFEIVSKSLEPSSINFVLIDSLEKIESDKGFGVILEELNTFAQNNNLSLIILK